MGSRANGTNPRAKGTNPRATETNPRALGGHPSMCLSLTKAGRRCRWDLNVCPCPWHPPVMIREISNA